MSILPTLRWYRPAPGKQSRTSGPPASSPPSATPPRSGIRLFPSLGAAALGAVGVYLALCTWSPPGPPPGDERRPPSPPRAEIATSGVAEAMDETALSFTMVGRVGEIFVELGDDVKKGQRLARLETDDLETAVESAETNVSLAQIRLRQLLIGADASDV